MTLITEEYRKMNTELHTDKASYGSFRDKYADGDIRTAFSVAQQVTQYVELLGATSVLDYGCGKQGLAELLPGQLVMGYDPAIPGLDETPDPADFVYCGDVLEHVEPECLSAVLDDIQRCAKKGVFLQIAKNASTQNLSDGRNAHLIQEQPQWWLPKIFSRFWVKWIDISEGDFSVFAFAQGHWFAKSEFYKIYEAKKNALREAA